MSKNKLLSYWMGIIYGIILSFIFVGTEICFFECGNSFLVPVFYAPLFIIISMLFIYSARNNKLGKFFMFLFIALIIIIVVNYVAKFTTFGIIPFENEPNGDFGEISKGDYFLGTSCDGYSLSFRINDFGHKINNDCYNVRRVCTESCTSYDIPSGTTEDCVSRCDDVRI